VRAQSLRMARELLRDRDMFYRDYVAACDELRIAPLPYPKLLALVETLAERPTATLHCHTIAAI